MNVLSIDFDIIMAPDIALYNPLIRAGAESESVSLEKLCNDFPALRSCRADLNHYHKIVSFIINHTSHLQVDDIRVAFNHEDIKHMLNNEKEVHVFSIDHHHDLGYPIPNEEKEEYNSLCTCANWGDFYFRNGTICDFTWIKNVNSDEPIDYANDSRVKMVNLADFDLNTLPKIDKMFLCLSPEWTSSMYFPLFYIILDLINNQKGCHLEMH